MQHYIHRSEMVTPSPPSISSERLAEPDEAIRGPRGVGHDDEAPRNACAGLGASPSLAGLSMATLAKELDSWDGRTDAPRTSRSP